MMCLTSDFLFVLLNGACESLNLCRKSLRAAVFMMMMMMIKLICYYWLHMAGLELEMLELLIKCVPEN